MAGAISIQVNQRINRSVRVFEKDINRFARRVAPQELLKLHRLIALQLLRGVVLKTPVDTGRARGNWQTTVDASPSDDEQLQADPISGGANKLGSLKPFGIVFLTNNVPYVVFLENGSSGQAPQGMVALTIAEVTAQFGV